MPQTQITTDHGTTVALVHEDGDTFVVLSNPDKYPDEPSLVAGQLVFDSNGFWPVPLASFAMRPAVLRAVADLIENNLSKES